MTARFLKMLFLVSNFLPLLIFVTLYVGTGLYLTAVGVEQAFYQLPPTIAILPGYYISLAPVPREHQRAIARATGWHASPRHTQYVPNFSAGRRF